MQEGVNDGFYFIDGLLYRCLRNEGLHNLAEWAGQTDNTHQEGHWEKLYTNETEKQLISLIETILFKHFCKEPFSICANIWLFF